MKNAALGLGTAAAVGGGLVWLMGGFKAPKAKKRPAGADLAGAAPIGAPEPATGTATPRPSYDTDEPRTPYDGVTTYNNFYEFGTSKVEPAENAHTLRPRPWTISFEGEIAKPATMDVDALVKLFP